MRFTGIISLIATAHATWDVTVHNNKIENTLEHIYEDGMDIYNSTAFQHYMKRMDRAEMKAKIEIDASQKEIWYPITKGMRDYLHWFTPVEKDCNVDVMTKCMMEKVKVEDEEADHDWILCGQRSNCSAIWSSLSFKEKMKLEKKFGKTENQLHKSLKHLKKGIKSEFKKAQKEEKENYEIIGDEYKDDVQDIMINWGCNKTCVDDLNITLDTTPNPLKNYAQIFKAFENCSCPLGVEVKTPAGDVIVGAEVPESQDVTELTAKTSTALNVNINSGGYTFLVVCIFIGQVVLIVFVKFFYMKRKDSQAEKKYWDRAQKWNDFQAQYLARCKAERESFKKHLELLDTTME